MWGNKDAAFKIRDEYFKRFAYTIARLTYSDQKLLRSNSLAPPRKMANNLIFPPNLNNVEHYEMVFQGGTMGDLRAALW